MEKPNPPMHAYKHRGGGREVDRIPPRAATVPEKFRFWKIGGNP